MSRKRKFILIKFVILFAITFSFLAYHYFYQRFCFETRYAFDFGSGAIKSKAVEFDMCRNQIYRVFGQFDKPIKFIHCLSLTETGSYHVDEKCINRAAIEFNNFENEYNISCQKNKCVGVATAWARKADNVDVIIEALAKQGVKMKVLSQNDEGLYGFNAVLNSNEIIYDDPQDVIVWDIGGGSFQLTTLDEQGQIHVYHGPHGIESFERELRQVLNLSAESELPFFTGTQLQKAYDYVYNHYGLAVLSDKIIAKKLINNPNVKIYGIGGPLTKGIKKQMYVPQIATLKNLEDTAKLFENRTEEDVYWNTFPELPMHYVKSAQISLILIHGVMKGAGFKEINIIDTTLSDYVLYQKDMWRTKKQ